MIDSDIACPSCHDHPEIAELFADLSPARLASMRRQARLSESVWRVERHLSVDRWTDSGTLGAALGISRHAAVKAVSYARSLGAPVVADHRLGYRLSAPNEVKP